MLIYICARYRDSAVQSIQHLWFVCDRGRHAGEVPVPSALPRVEPQPEEGKTGGFLRRKRALSLAEPSIISRRVHEYIVKISESVEVFHLPYAARHGNVHRGVDRRDFVPFVEISRVEIHICNAELIDLNPRCDLLYSCSEGDR